MTVVQAGLVESTAPASGTRAGVGYSENPNSRQAAAEAARIARERMGTGECDLVLLFATSRHDPDALLQGARSVVGPAARIVGGAAVGTFTNDRLGYEGHQVGVAALSLGGAGAEVLAETNLAGREYEAGLSLGRRLRQGASEDDALLLMYDLVQESGGTGAEWRPIMARPLLQGLSEAYGPVPATAGMGLVGDLQFTSGTSYQFVEDRVQERSALAVRLAGGPRMDTLILHGCRPSGGYHVITRAEGNLVLEVDGRPALDVFRELLGQGGETAWEDFPNFIPIGVNHGDKFGEFREDDYSLRFCTALDRERRGLIMVSDDLQPGVEFQLMRRSLDFDDIRARVDGLLERTGGRRPVFALYIDCVARAAAYCGTDQEDGEVVQRALGPDIPLLGLYCGLEITRIGTAAMSTNFTGVLCLFSEPG